MEQGELVCVCVWCMHDNTGRRDHVPTNSYLTLSFMGMGSTICMRRMIMEEER